MTLTIPANDHGQLRVFALDGAPPQALRDKTDAGLAAAFGAVLNGDYVDVLDVAALGEMTLTDYIKQGYDLHPDDADRTALAGITDWAILIMSRATGEEAVTLSLAPGIHHVTTIGTPMTLAPQAPLESAAAEGLLTPPTKPAMSDARIGGMIATLALVVLFVLVGLMIWIAG